jgi:hypothetical protein
LNVNDVFGSFKRPPFGDFRDINFFTGKEQAILTPKFRARIAIIIIRFEAMPHTVVS